MLILNKSDIVGEGNSRIVYQHPNEFKKVIKIEKKYFENNNKPNNQIDFLYFNYLVLKKRDLSQVCTCYGWIETNYGKGLLFDKVLNHNGLTAVTLREAILKRISSKESLKESFEKLIKYLERNIIILADISLDNIMCQYVDEKKLKLIIIDGLGSRKLKFQFKYYLMFDTLAKIKVKKQNKKLVKEFYSTIDLVL